MDIRSEALVDHREPIATSEASGKTLAEAAASSRAPVESNVVQHSSDIAPKSTIRTPVAEHKTKSRKSQKKKKKHAGRKAKYHGRHVSPDSDSSDSQAEFSSDSYDSSASDSESSTSSASEYRKSRRHPTKKRYKHKDKIDRAARSQGRRHHRGDATDHSSSDSGDDSVGSGQTEDPGRDDATLDQIRNTLNQLQLSQLQQLQASLRNAGQQTNSLLPSTIPCHQPPFPWLPVPGSFPGALGAHPPYPLPSTPPQFASGKNTWPSLSHTSRPNLASNQPHTPLRGGPVTGTKESHSDRHGRSSEGGRGRFKRVDQIWDTTTHNYKLQETERPDKDGLDDGYLFQVRRTFDWEGKHKSTIVDIHSKPLRKALEEVMGTIKGVGLVGVPKLDPNLLFLYLEDLRDYMRALKHMKPASGDKSSRKREQRRIDRQRKHVKVLVQYLDADFAEVKESLYPMLENGLITYEFLWALWKPGTLIYSATYGCHDEPRVFKVELAEKQMSFTRGEFYWIEGKHFDYDGKKFGYSSIAEEIGSFQGARRINSLDCYPLKYHANESKLRKELIERGKKFVRLAGVHYKSHHGLAFCRRKKIGMKVYVDGRVMIDAATHRRINPNYMMSLVRSRDDDASSDLGDSSSDEKSSASSIAESDDEGNVKAIWRQAQKSKKRTLNTDMVEEDVVDGTPKQDSKQPETPEPGPAAPAAGDTKSQGPQRKTNGSDEMSTMVFTDDQYLLASSLVLGFAFSEKLWLEFTVSGVEDISWNETAYDSLVLEPKTKDIVRALVESHKYHAAERIDDIIQGKGKGLVAVLHGPPGTGKTLTAEGISELLKCPLYVVSAGELGTDSRYLEVELQRILDICHTWGAILLLDEADVFLERRNMHDLHRNALVSIFLRQLEYFQGILFLTTNRVETFDEAFQSRIHIALRYGELDQRARKSIFKLFIDRVREVEKSEAPAFTDGDFAELAKHPINGRQIKNTVRTAQALALNKGVPLSMQHIKQVLNVQMSFERDLRGGPGYQEAMRSYF